VWRHSRWLCLIVASGLAAGCASRQEELKYAGQQRDLQYYRDQATRIDYSNVVQESPEAVSGSAEPRRIRHPRKDDIHDLNLSEALQTALFNAEVIRDNAQFLNAGNRILNNPDFATSIHDVALQETNQLFGQGGIEAALAEFDATFTANMTWGRNEQVADSRTIGFAELTGQNEEFGDFRSNLSKIFGDGGQISLEHNWLYSGTNQSDLLGGRPFKSEFTSRSSANADGGLPTFGVEYRRPLLQGAGTEYTRIAGPIARRPTLQSTPTVNQGVVVARIRTDISIADFEASVAQLLHDVEESYWDLYLAYQTYDAESVATHSALQTWREVRAGMDAGKVGAADEAQARDNYFETRARRENSLASLYTQEVRLRRLLGLPVNNGQIIRPMEDPMTAQVSPDWNLTLAEALTNRPEVRRQKWNIRSLELQYSAAEMLVKPRLDFVARYQANGFGDRLTGSGDNFSSAYSTLFSGNFTGWGLGFEFSMPIGFRGALTQVQNYEHRLAKSRAMLAQQEQEISYELAAVFQQIDQTYQTARTNFNRRRAAQRRVEAFQAEYKVGRASLDLVLRAQISQAQADIAYYSSLVGYNRSLNDLRFRKGTLLADNSVFLSESLWTADAYDDALRKAWTRSFAFDAPSKDTAPEEFAMECPTCEPNSAWIEQPQPVPVEEALPPTVPPPAEPAVPGADSPDNRSALRSTEDQSGGLEGAVPSASRLLPEGSGLLPDRPSAVPLKDLPEPAPSRTEPAPSLLKSGAAVQPAPLSPLNIDPEVAPAAAVELLDPPAADDARSEISVESDDSTVPLPELFEDTQSRPAPIRGAKTPAAADDSFEPIQVESFDGQTSGPAPQDRQPASSKDKFVMPVPVQESDLDEFGELGALGDPDWDDLPANRAVDAQQAAAQEPARAEALSGTASRQALLNGSRRPGQGGAGSAAGDLTGSHWADLGGEAPAAAGDSGVRQAGATGSQASRNSGAATADYQESRRPGNEAGATAAPQDAASGGTFWSGFKRVFKRD